jgi:hypothetical protein
VTYRRPQPLGQLSFFDAPEVVPLPAFGQHVRLVLTDTLAKARDVRGLDREAVAAEMSRLQGEESTGRKFTKRMLDAYCAPSGTDWRFPLEALPLLHAATGDDRLLNLTATACDQKVVPSEAAGLAELMLLEIQARQIRERRKILERRLPTGAVAWASHEAARRRT